MTSVVVADAGLGAGGRERPVQVLVAAAALVAVGSDFPLPVGRITVALVVALLLAPVTVLTTWRLTRWARGFILLTSAAMVWGVWLAVRPGLRVGDTGHAREDLFLMATLLLGTCVVVWARTLLRDEWVAGLFGVGLLVHGATAGGQFASNPWKFGFALPVAVILLSLAWAARSWRLEVVLLVVLAFLSAVTDSRSGFALLALTALLVIWSQRPRVGSRRRWVGSFVLLGAAFFGIYKVAEALIVNGYLGQATQLRTEAQIQAGSSLILGSRPELGASLALMRAHLMGFGVGENPTPGTSRWPRRGWRRSATTRTTGTSSTTCSAAGSSCTRCSATCGPTAASSDSRWRRTCASSSSGGSPAASPSRPFRPWSSTSASG